MTIEEFNQIASEILGNISDVGSVSQNLERLRSAFGEQFAAAEAAAAEANDLKTRNESLQKANMELFLKIGESAVPESESDAEEPEAMDFEELFNEKGELK